MEGIQESDDTLPGTSPSSGGRSSRTIRSSSSPSQSSPSPSLDVSQYAVVFENKVESADDRCVPNAMNQPAKVMMNRQIAQGEQQFSEDFEKLAADMLASGNVSSAPNSPIVQIPSTSASAGAFCNALIPPEFPSNESSRVSLLLKELLVEFEKMPQQPLPRQEQLNLKRLLKDVNEKSRFLKRMKEDVDTDSTAGETDSSADVEDSKGEDDEQKKL